MNAESSKKPGKPSAKMRLSKTIAQTWSWLPSHCGDKILTACLLMVGGFSQQAGAEPAIWQPLDTIVEAATRAVTDQFHGKTDDYEIEIREPDSRLRLKQCRGELHAEPLAEIAGQQRVAIQVRCDDAPGWKIYVQASVRQFAEVIVARRNLPRGHILTTEDLAQKRLSLSALAGGFITDDALLLERKLLRTVSAGSALRPNDVKALPAIKRGQTVNLVVRNATIQIKMTGNAMTDGVVGQRIMVKNASSGRIVEGIVRDQTTIEVL